MTTATAYPWEPIVLDETLWTVLDVLDDEDEAEDETAPAPLFSLDPPSPLDAMRARLQRLAAQYPLGTRVGTTEQFVEELDRGQELRDEAHILVS